MDTKIVQFLEALPVGVFVVNKQQDPCYINEEGCRLLAIKKDQLTNIKDIYLNNICQISSLEPYPAKQHPILLALQGAPSQITDIQLSQNNKNIALEMTVKPLLNEQGQIDYAIVTLHNISTRKPQEKILKNKSPLSLSVNEAYERFIPKAFVKFLEKKSIVDVQIGDKIEVEMTVLFSDIRNYTQISEKMTPQENFNFINDYLKQMEPLIGHHNGFIDKYIGDCIMALFPSNVDDAISTGVDMLKTLNIYNNKRVDEGKEAIHIGIGINTGKLILGTIGGKDRMDSTVISDTVNLASRVEGANKQYGTSLLITEQTMKKIKNPTQYFMRYIDNIKVRGKSHAVNIYEVFNGDSGKNFQLKKETLADFNQGIALLKKERFSLALKYFGNVKRINAADKTAHIHIKRCADGLEGQGIRKEFVDSMLENIFANKEKKSDLTLFEMQKRFG